MDIELQQPEVLLTDRGLGPWSFSKLKTLQQCPLQFYLKYILKLKVQRVQEGLPVSEIGSAAHKILEHVVIHGSVGDGFKEAKKSYLPSIGEAYWKEHVESLELNIIEFAHKLEEFDRKTPIKNRWSELRIGVTYEWERTGFFATDVYFRGIIDLILFLENQDALIIDHKTGGGTQYGGIKNYTTQLDIYKLMMHYGVQKIKGAQSGIHFIREGAIVLDDYTPAEEIETRLKNRLQFYIESAIDSVKEIGYFKHKRGNLCKYCEFDPACKEGFYKPMEVESKKYFPIGA